MAKITIGNAVDQIKQDGYITLNDSVCGAGATLIAGIHEIGRQLNEAGYNWQNHVLVIVQDIDYIVGMMCYIQLSLLGCAGYIKIGNTISDPICENDNMEKYWFTPMYFSNVWQCRRSFHSLDLLFGRE